MFEVNMVNISKAEKVFIIHFVYAQTIHFRNHFYIFSIFTGKQMQTKIAKWKLQFLINVNIYVNKPKRHTNQQNSRVSIFTKNAISLPSYYFPSVLRKLNKNSVICIFCEKSYSAFNFLWIRQVQMQFQYKLQYNYFKTSSMLNIPHKKIGSYLLFTSKRVAQLKHSSVFLGVNFETKQKVLIKTFSKAEFQNNSVLMISLQFQINAMEILKNQKVLKFKELIETSNNYYLILEQPKGLSIKKKIQTKEVFSQNSIVQNLKKLRKTFQTLNKYNIIHGNINAKSILLNHGDAKISYPSYLKAMKSIQSIKCSSMIEETQNKNKLNDFLYMAPELLQNGIVSQKYDIWSLGVIIYQSLFNMLPWNLDKKQNINEMLEAFQNQKLTFPSEIQISVELKHLIANCLRVNPEERLSWNQYIEHSIFSTVSQELLKEQNETEQELNTKFNYDSMKDTMTISTRAITIAIFN